MTNQIRSIQALRGLACIAVVTFHYRYQIESQYPAFHKLLSNGFIGVDLFFILSGFVITLSVSRMGYGVLAAGEFLKRRVLRLLPTYFILLLINFLLSGAMATFHYADRTQALISAFTLSVYMPHQAPFYVNDSGFMGVRWTLNYEFLFYLMMTICLLVRARWVALTAMLLATLIVVPMAIGQQPTLLVSGYNMGYSYLNLVTNPIIWQFAAGILIGLVYPYMVRLPIAMRIFFLIAAMILFVQHIISNQHVGHGMTESGTILALLLAAIAFNDNWLKRITPRWLVFMGDISFSVYLIHIVIKDRLSKYFTDEGLMFFLCALLMVIFFGWLSYLYIEPIGYKLARRIKGRKIHTEVS